MGAWEGAFDCLNYLPVGDKRYESSNHPGWIATIRSPFDLGFFHPLDKQGRPLLNVVLNNEGSVVRLKP